MQTQSSRPLQVSLQILDLRQERCPMAMVKVKLALKQRQSGESLQFLLSDPGSRRDVPRWLDKVGIPYERQECAAYLTLLVEAQS
ncbi:sulfurtransferase TusA family protein [Ferrimonas balearica]|uniref:sulfurtransferase TusA family protein n=1 Tax=Ferrimonas balearica TaxID=44012 RepID=UPI001C99D511|nr:sulfurtransferase TusA family protein [Ferrimonas balearica]MBY5990943.1 sulfurtransferase TusA family protein [Ferrimonas balearica]